MFVIGLILQTFRRLELIYIYEHIYEYISNYEYISM